MPGLSQSVSQLCDRALTDLDDGPVLSGVSEVHTRLGEPIRIAVAGRVSAGKSTLVNALLGIRVAPTAAGECTRVVTWFRYGEADRAEVRLRDGSVRPLALRADRSLPDSLPWDLADIEAISVWLYTDLLESMSLIDTPGLASLTEATRTRTETLLATRSCEAAAQADALVYVLSGEARDDDEQVLTAFHSHSGGLRTSAVNAVALLNKVDKLADDQASVEEAAQRVTEVCARQLAPSVASVIPVIGLLAETTEAGRLGEEHARRLRALAALSDDQKNRMLLSVRRFLEEQGVPLELEGRQDLLGLLDLFGIRCSLETIDRDGGGAVALTHALRAISGIDRLRDLLERTFTRRAGILKAGIALSALRRLAALHSDPRNAELLAAMLREQNEQLALLPEMGQVREMEALHTLASHTTDLSHDLREDLRRLAASDTAADKLGLGRDGSTELLRTAALDRTATWRAFANDGRRTPAEVRAARVVILSYARLIRELTPDSTPSR